MDLLKFSGGPFFSEPAEESRRLPHIQTGLLINTSQTAIMILECFDLRRILNDGSIPEMPYLKMSSVINRYEYKNDR